MVAKTKAAASIGTVRVTVESGNVILSALNDMGEFSMVLSPEQSREVAEHLAMAARLATKPGDAP